MTSKPKLHQAMILAIGGLSFFFLAATDPQCARVDDRVTAPDNSSFEVDAGRGGLVAECVRDCLAAVKVARDAEKELHKELLEACGGDSECIAAEDARHEAVMEQISLDLRDCISPCHEQGGGRGGDE